MYTWRERKKLRLHWYDYFSNGYYFVTLCTKNRESFLWEIISGISSKSEIGILVEQCWANIPEHFPNTKIHDFVIMPNHIHGIIEIFWNDECTIPKNTIYPVGNENFRSLQNDESTDIYFQTSLSSVIKWFKIGVTKKCREKGIYDFAWQKSFYDVIIKNEEQLWAVQKYIIENPLKWEADRYNETNLNSRKMLSK